MISPHYIVATAGHVDHGKSALVKALTGIDPDRLPEEKARGITIDLGFAHLALARTAPREPPPPPFLVGLVDVPGHEDFVKNMVAGVGSIDLALLVVAADDGWMPQTEEHLQILTYLGVRRAVVALTKIDLAQNELLAATRVREQLAGSPFADAPVVPTSVVSGRGLAELKQALVQVLEQAPAPRDYGKPRLPVDRVFTLRGIGTVVTGTLSGGSLQRSQAVILQPGARPARIRSVQTYGQEVAQSEPGTRTALNLAEATSDGRVARGDVVTLPNLGAPSDTWDVWLARSARLRGNAGAAARPLKQGARVQVHLGTAHAPAWVLLCERQVLEAGEESLGQLRLEQPLFAFAGDRFIVRDWSEQATLAGGLVLEPAATRRGLRAESRQRCLRRRADQPEDVEAWVQSGLERDGAARRSEILVPSHFGADEIAAALDRLAAQHKAVLVGDLAADAPAWQGWEEQAALAIDQHHRAHPEQGGLALPELKAALQNVLPAPAVFEALLRDLGRHGFAQVGSAIRRAAHRPVLPTQLQAAGARVRAALARKPLEPPSRKDLAPDPLALQALRFLLQTGEAIDLSEEVVLSAEAYAQAAELVRQHLRARRTATASELRQLLGTSRRILIPLLERLDREGVTRREGDQRVLRAR